MKLEAKVTALQDSGVRYLLAGGLAVNAHGYLPFTKDVDVVVQSTPENTERAFTALNDLGYRLSVSITAAQFGGSAPRIGKRRSTCS